MATGYLLPVANSLQVFTDQGIVGSHERHDGAGITLAPATSRELSVDAAGLAAGGGKITAFIGSDNAAAGQMAGTALADTLGTAPTVGLIAGPEGNVASEDRIQGASQSLSGATLDGPIPADWDTDKAQAAATALIDRNPSIGAIFAANDQMALGVIQAVASSGKDILTVGVDGIQQMLDGLAKQWDRLEESARMAKISLDWIGARPNFSL